MLSLICVGMTMALKQRVYVCVCVCVHKRELTEVLLVPAYTHARAHTRTHAQAQTRTHTPTYNARFVFRDH